MNRISTLYHPESGVSYTITEKKDYLPLRKQRLEVDWINDIIEKNQMQDSLSMDVKDIWQNKFQPLIKTDNEQEIIQTFIPLLQELLYDHFFNVPLNEDAVLGNDGHVYNSYSLKILQSVLSKEYQERSPRDLDNPAIFKTQPHSFVKECIHFLKRWGSYTHPSDLEDKYKRLLILQYEEKQKESIQKRSDYLAKIKQNRDAQQRKYDENLQKLTDHIARANLEISNDIRETFQEINEEQNRFKELQIKCINDMKGQVANRVQEVSQEIEHLEKTIEELSKKRQQLSNKLDKGKEDMKQVHRENTQLQHAINETRLIIAQRKKSSRLNLKTTLLIVAGCVAATAVFQYALVASATPGHIAVLPNFGGVGFKYVLPL